MAGRLIASFVRQLAPTVSVRADLELDLPTSHRPTACFRISRSSRTSNFGMDGNAADPRDRDEALYRMAIPSGGRAMEA